MDKAAINKRFRLTIDAIMETNLAPSKNYIAAKLGITPQKLSEILNGRMNIGVDLAAAVCLCFNVSAEWLLTEKGEMFCRPLKASLPAGSEKEYLDKETGPENRKAYEVKLSEKNEEIIRLQSELIKAKDKLLAVLESGKIN